MLAALVANKRIHYSNILLISYVISEENKLQLLYCSLAVYLLLFHAFYYLPSPIRWSVL